jgi:hypothetical protein
MLKNKLIVTSAIYGKPGSANPNDTKDVMAEINRRIDEHKFHFAQSYNDIFGDPYKGHRKELRIKGEFIKCFKKLEFYITYKERDEIKLPEDILNHKNTKIKFFWWRCFVSAFLTILGVGASYTFIFNINNQTHQGAGDNVVGDKNEYHIGGDYIAQPQQKDPIDDTELATTTNLTSKPKSLYEYFASEFSKYLSVNQKIGITVSASTSATSKEEDYELDFRLHCDFESLTKFISVRV